MKQSQNFLTRSLQLSDIVVSNNIDNFLMLLNSATDNVELRYSRDKVPLKFIMSDQYANFWNHQYKISI